MSGNLEFLQSGFYNICQSTQSYEKEWSEYRDNTNLCDHSGSGPGNQNEIETSKSNV